jgi:hypothetical protein
MATSRRRRWIWLVAFALLLLGAWLGVRALLQPERLSAFLLQQASQTTGLEFTLGAPADVGLWPDLHLELEGLSARIPGSGVVVLQAEAVEAVLPWSALRADTIQLRSLRLQSPVIDTAALSQWLQSRDQEGPPAPFQLPQIDAALSVSSGRIHGDGWAVAALELALPYLHPGEPVQVKASGSIDIAERAPMPFDLDLDVTPTQSADQLRFEPLRLALRTAPGVAAWLNIEGAVALLPADALQLDVVATLPEWPATWPALPFPLTDSSNEVRIELDYIGSTTLQGTLELSLARGDADLRGTLAIGELFAWLDDPEASPLPPLTGELSSDLLDAGGVELRGVRIRIDDAPPAASGDGD